MSTTEREALAAEVKRLADQMMRDSWASGDDAAWQPACAELHASIDALAAAPAPQPEAQAVEALREQAHEAARQALSDAMSEGHPLGGAMASKAASESERELRAAIDALAAAALRPQAAPAVDEGPEFTDWARNALLWVLWHHQGGSSPVGQPIRFALGMGQHDPMSADQVERAKRWGALTRQAPGSCRESAAPAQQPLTDADITRIGETLGERVPGERDYESWGLGYRQDDAGEFTIPRIPHNLIPFARAIEAAHGIRSQS